MKDKKETNIKRKGKKVTESKASAHAIFIKEEYDDNVEESFPVIEESLTDVSETKIEDESTEDPLSKDNLVYNGYVHLYCTTCKDRAPPTIRSRVGTCPRCFNLYHYQCPTCAKVYARGISAYKHARNICGKLPRHRCPHCPFASYNSTTTTLHIKHRHTRIDPSDYATCPSCGKRYKHVNKMRTHLKTCGQGPVKFVCSHCELQFANTYNLKKHQIMKHPDTIEQQAMHVCPNCSKVYLYRTSLETHIKNVCGVKLVRCDHCKLSTTNKRNLTKHMKRMHRELYESTEDADPSVVVLN